MPFGRVQLVAGERRVVDAASRPASARSLPRACTLSTSHSAGLPVKRRGDAVEVAHDAGLVVGGHRAHQAGARRLRAQPVQVVAAVAADGDRHHLEVQAEQRDSSAAAPRAPPCARWRRTAAVRMPAGPGRVAARRRARADSTAVWMPSVAPLVKSSRPLPAPSTRRAQARTSSSSARAFRPVPWLLLGLPKPSAIAASAASRASGSTGVVALASR